VQGQSLRARWRARLLGAEPPRPRAGGVPRSAARCWDAVRLAVCAPAGARARRERRTGSRADGTRGRIAPVPLMPTYFAVRRRRGPSWNPGLTMREQAGWGAHAAFMNALAAEGFVVLGGPLGDGAETLLIVDATSEDVI